MEKKQTKIDLENKISELESKLVRLSDQLQSKPISSTIPSVSTDRFNQIKNKGHDSIESYFGQYDSSITPEQFIKAKQLEKYEADYLNRIDSEKYSFSKPSVTLPKGFNYVEPRLPRTRSGGTLPKGFGSSGASRYREGQDSSSKSNTLSKRNRLIMSVPITAALITIVGVISQSEIVSIIMVGSAPIPFTLIAIGLKVFKTKQKDMSNGVNVKASFLQSIMIMLGIAKVHKVEQTPETNTIHKRGTLPKGF